MIIFSSHYAGYNILHIHKCDIGIFLSYGHMSITVDIFKYENMVNTHIQMIFNPFIKI